MTNQKIRPYEEIAKECGLRETPSPKTLKFPIIRDYTHEPITENELEPDMIIDGFLNAHSFIVAIFEWRKGLVAKLENKIIEYNKEYRKNLKKIETEPDKERFYGALSSSYLTRMGELDWILRRLGVKEKQK